MTMRPEDLISHAEFLRGLARRLIADDHLSADVAQQACVAALTRPPADGRHPAAWFSKVARNLVRKRFRAESRRKRREQAVARPERVLSTHEVVAREETRRKVVDAVLGLKEPYRSTILLRFYEDLSHQEVAETLGVPLETMRTHLKRGLAQLRRRLDGLWQNDRSAWCLALAPLAGLHMGATAPAAATTSSTLVAGILAMTIKTKIVLSTVLVAGLCLTLLYMGHALFDHPDRFPGLADDGYPGNPEEGLSSEISDDRGTPIPLAAAVPERGRRLRGRAVDPDGQPLEGATIMAVWAGRPSDGVKPLSLSGLEGTFHGRVLTMTDRDGLFETTLSGTSRCFVFLRDTSDPFLIPWMHYSFTPELWEGRWVDLPEENLLFTASRRPSGLVVVNAVDESTGCHLSGFTCSFWSAQTKNYYQSSTKTELLEKRLPVHVGNQVDFQASFSHASLTEDIRQTFTLHSGELKELTFSVPKTHNVEIRGRVVDSSGWPVEGALVYLGTQVRMRGDEPFKPFRVGRIKDGTRTDDRGDFTLPGWARTVTVWHDDYSPVTVPATGAKRIEIPARGAIEGWLVGEAGVEVGLDRDRKAIVDEQGRFFFDRVVAGMRGIVLPGKRYVAVAVEPGETARVEMTGLLPEVHLELRAGGEVWREPPGWLALVGLGDLSTTHFIKQKEPGPLPPLKGVLPGKYLSITRTGQMASVDVDGPLAVADFGRAMVTVRTRKGGRVFIRPAGVHELAALLSVRQIGKPALPSTGVSFGPLPAGRYDVGIEGKGTFATIDLGEGEETEITID
jgi:RNA polymerase sigma factor (sigma-70 family)